MFFSPPSFLLKFSRRPNHASLFASDDDAKIYLVPRANDVTGVRLRMMIVTVSSDGQDLTWKERPFNLPVCTDLPALASGWNAVHATQYHIEHYVRTNRNAFCPRT